MKEASRFGRRLWAAVSCSVLSSASVLLCMIELDGSLEWIVRLAVPLLFWIGLVLEQVFIWSANHLRRRIETELVGRRAEGLPGVCSFFRTQAGVIIDLMFILSVVVYAVLAIGHWGSDIAQYIVLFLIVLSFRLHCFANGKNYRYNLYLQKRRERS